MSSEPNNPLNIGGKGIEGGPPADQQVLQFNFANNQWEYVPLPAAGEVNLGTNVGAGGGLVFRDKTGVTLNFKTLIAGAGISINDNADDITITGATAALGDLEFLRDKELSGDLINVTGLTAAVAPSTAVSFVPATGKTFFIANSYHIHANDSAATDRATSRLENNGVNIDEKTSVTINGVTTHYQGVIAGDSLVGDGALIFRIQKTQGLNNHRITGTMLGWIQNT